MYKSSLVTSLPLDIARRYHAAWTTGDHARAAALLAEDLTVEVPINEYPTKASFVAAVERFAAATETVSLIAATSGDDDAVLVYDMDVHGLGRLRVAEHFVIDGAEIRVIRQIHDTAAMRAPGVAE